jgi:hypothetical protein
MQPGESAGQQAQRRRGHAESLRAQAKELNERADRVERSGEMWGRGHAGEQTVGAQLELLRPHGFDVLHDVRWPGRKRANIDHVAVGPPGILVVDAKNWSGDVTIHYGVLRQNGYTREREVSAARQAGQDVAAQLTLPWALHVIPAIALAAPDSQGVRQSEGVTVVGHRDLVDWAVALPTQLTPGDVLGIAGHLRTSMPPASLPAPRNSRRITSHRAPREPSARQRQRAAKRAAARRETLLKFGACLLLILLAPALLKWWGTHGTDVVRSVVPTPTFSAPSSAAPPVQTFETCAAMRVVYPAGVKHAGARNIGKKARGKVAADDRVYRANAQLDQDHDSIACERTRRVNRDKS